MNYKERLESLERERQALLEEVKDMGASSSVNYYLVHNTKRNLKDIKRELKALEEQEDWLHWALATLEQYRTDEL